MKKLLLFSILITLSFVCSGQEVFNTNNQQKNVFFKGLYYGMTKKEARKEFRKNKKEYTNIDIGNGWVYATDVYNLIVSQSKGLRGAQFFIKNSKTIGLGYKNASNALIMTRNFFEEIGYTVFLENRYWKYPINFSAPYGLVLVDKDRTKIAHIFPAPVPNEPYRYSAGLIMYEYDSFMAEYNYRNKVIENKQENAGF